MYSIEFLLEIPNRPRVAEKSFKSASPCLRDHVGIAIDAESRNIALAQLLEKHPGTAPKIENPRAFCEDLEIGVMPSPKIGILLGRPMEERKPLPPKRQRMQFSVAQET